MLVYINAKLSTPCGMNDPVGQLTRDLTLHPQSSFLGALAQR
jgi:hypothetical protein